MLRKVAGNASLAVALLGFAAGVSVGLAPEVASAKATLFELRTGAANPLDGIDLGELASPVLGDLDGDGDLDALAGDQAGTFRYYMNSGSASAPAFVLRTGAADPLAGASVAGMSSPALGDLDGDGDLDLVVGRLEGRFDFFENTGSATSPDFAPRVGSANPFDAFQFGGGVPTWATAWLADLDADGDLELVAGERDGSFGYFENTGTATVPAFVAVVGAANPLATLDVGDGSRAAAGDLDGDGDLDLVAGNGLGLLLFYENTGTATAPAFALRSGAASPVGVPSLGGAAAPALADLDGDGDLDLVVGEQDGTFAFLENLSGRLVARTGSANPLAPIVPGPSGQPAFGDLDGDGDDDLLVGSDTGTLRFFANTGSASNPAYVERTGSSNPLAGQDVGAASDPTLGDLDGDGDLDLVVGEDDGVFNYYANTGTPASPAFAARTGAANPLNGQDVGSRSTPSLGDLDHDGDLDLVAGDQGGLLAYAENTGTAVSPAFALRVGSANPLDGVDVGARSAPDLGDADGDGDLDLVTGTSTGAFVYSENTALAAIPVFTPRTGAANPLDGVDVGSDAAPAWVDLDGDGDEDVVVGKLATALELYENTILDASIAAMELQFALNPLDGSSVAGGFSSPALGDVDGDGDLDVVAGNYGGDFQYFENTGEVGRGAFVERFGGAHPLAGFDAGDVSSPVLGDLDGDGDLDLVAGHLLGQLAWLENTGSATSPAFVQRTGAANPLAGRDVGYLSAPALGDLDADGDLDLIVGDLDGVFDYLENTGSATRPAFVRRTGAANPCDAQFVPGWSAPALGDVDRDGDLDLVSGDQLGQFAWLENTGTSRAPAFVARTGATNPMLDQDVGGRSTPALGDLDADGQLDLVTGNNAATLQTFVLPEPAASGMLALGLAGLRGLAQRRLSRRRRAR